MVVSEDRWKIFFHPGNYCQNLAIVHENAQKVRPQVSFQLIFFHVLVKWCIDLLMILIRRWDLNWDQPVEALVVSPMNIPVWVARSSSLLFCHRWRGWKKMETRYQVADPNGGQRDMAPSFRSKKCHFHGKWVNFMGKYGLTLARKNVGKKSPLPFPILSPSFLFISLIIRYLLVSIRYCTSLCQYQWPPDWKGIRKKLLHPCFLGNS